MLDSLLPPALLPRSSKIHARATPQRQHYGFGPAHHASHRSLVPLEQWSSASTTPTTCCASTRVLQQQNITHTVVLPRHKMLLIRRDACVCMHPRLLASFVEYVYLFLDVFLCLLCCDLRCFAATKNNGGEDLEPRGRRLFYEGYLFP